MRSADATQTSENLGCAPSSSHYGTLPISGNMASLPCFRMLEKSRQLGPLIGRVRQCFAQRALGRYLWGELVHPLLEGAHQWRAAFFTNLQRVCQAPHPASALPSFALLIDLPFHVDTLPR